MAAGTGSTLGLFYLLLLHIEAHAQIAKSSHETPYSHIGKPPVAAHCQDLYSQGQTESGVYTIQPVGLPKTRVYCDMQLKGGGWTAIQRRFNGAVNFYRNWQEYADGFGDIGGEHWLGLRTIHLLTHSTPMKLLVMVEDMENNTRYAHYSFFSIASEMDQFRLDLGNYHGDASDSLDYHRGQKFGTKDRDNDAHGGKCGEICKGAWWYNSCYHSNLNGEYLKGLRDTYGMAWSNWKGSKYSMKTSYMYLKPIYF